jgi:hypothetical protein
MCVAENLAVSVVGMEHVSQVATSAVLSLRYITQTVHCHESHNVKNQIHPHFTYNKMFNYNPTYFKPITGSCSGMSQIITTYKIQQQIQLLNKQFKMQLLLLICR